MIGISKTSKSMAMNPYKLRYTVYTTYEIENNPIDYYCTPEWMFDRHQHNRAIKKLAEGLTISEAFQEFPELIRTNSRNQHVDMPIADQTILTFIGNRNLTMPELCSLFVSSLKVGEQSNNGHVFLAVQQLYLKSYIAIQPAILRDENGRLFCLRCLQAETIMLHDCGACGSHSENEMDNKSSCYVCTGCAAYGEVRSCIPMLSLTRLGLEIQSECDSKKYKPVSLHVGPVYPHPLSKEQELVSSAICRIVKEGKNCLVWAVCGAGKTELVFQAIASAKNEADSTSNACCKVLIATPRKDVVMELLPRFTKAFPNDTVHAVYGGSTNKHIQAGITIATTHQLIRYQSDTFDLVIIDEIDAFPYAGDPILYKHAHRLSKQFIYMTATPDQEVLKQVKRKELEAVTLFQRHHTKPLPEPTFVRCDSLTPKGIELAAKETIVKWFMQLMGKELHQTVISIAFERVLRQLPNTGVVMFFVPSIERGRRLWQLLQQYIATTNHESVVAFVHAKDPERSKKIADLRVGKYNWIVTTTILERGVTIPDSHVVVIDAHHPVFTKATLIQIAGRVGRTIEHPEGKVFLLAQHMNSNIQAAIKEIKAINRHKNTIENTTKY